MPLYRWKGITPAGVVRNGCQTAVNTEQLNHALLSQGIAILECSEKSVHNPVWKYLQRRRITTALIVLFFEQLEVLVGSGVELVRALEVISQQISHAVFKAIIVDLANTVSHGANFHAALEKYPTIFSSFIIQIAASGEKTGRLAATFSTISQHLQQTTLLKQKLKNAALTPLITLFTALTLLIGIVTFIIPYFHTLYQTLGKPIPSATQRLIYANNFITSWQGRLTLIMIIMASYALYMLLKKSRFCKALADQIFLHLPIIKTIIIYSNRALFTQTLAHFLQAGLPLSLALEQAQHITTNAQFTKDINHMRQAIIRGASLHNATLSTNSLLLDPHCLTMINAGERSGALVSVLQKIAHHTQIQLSYQLTAISTLFTPLLMILVGFLIGGLLAIIYLPLFNLGSLFGI